MDIRFATTEDVALISQLAEKIWWPAYSGIISDDQISFMLNDMYAEGSLQRQMENGIEFILAERGGEAVGFAGFSMTEADNAVFKLHKLYVLPSEQGKGTGKALLHEVEDIGRSREARILELNVNRGNPALEFYKRMGLGIFKEVDIPYHQYVMNDYIMRKLL